MAIVKLGEAPIKNIKKANYLVSGVKPIASAQELADAVLAKIPDANITFKPDLELKPILDNLLKPINDINAQKEWGWQAQYNQEDIIDDMIEELRCNPHRHR